jgi:hypothetical protein
MRDLLLTVTLCVISFKYFAEAVMKCVLLLLVGTTMLCVSQSRAQSPIPADSLQLWLRSDVGVDKLNGTVSRWRDQSGKGNDVIQLETVRQPLFVDNILNHKPVLRFDGFDDKLGFTGSTPMSQFTLFMVVKNDSGGGPHNCHLINFGPYGGDWYQWFFVLFGGLDRVQNLIALGEGPNGGMNANATNIAADGKWMIISIVYQSIFNESLRWNGNAADMTLYSGPGPSFFGPMGDSTGSGGGIGGGDGEPFGNLLTAKSDFAEVIVYNTVLTDPQLLAIEQYLNSRYNIATGVKEKQGNLPERFVLEQNYPNPFNPSTNISYSLLASASVSLRIFNALGQEVASLVNERKPAGYYQVTWNANVPSGIYFYRLQAGEYVETKKMILLR